VLEPDVRCVVSAPLDPVVAGVDVEPAGGESTAFWFEVVGAGDPVGDGAWLGVALEEPPSFARRFARICMASVWRSLLCFTGLYLLGLLLAE
jgi:hypothetical protein